LGLDESAHLAVPPFEARSELQSGTGLLMLVKTRSFRMRRWCRKPIRGLIVELLCGGEVDMGTHLTCGSSC